MHVEDAGSSRNKMLASENPKLATGNDGNANASIHSHGESELFDAASIRRTMQAEFPAFNKDDLDWICAEDRAIERIQVRRFRQSALHLYAGEVLAGALSRAFVK